MAMVAKHDHCHACLFYAPSLLLSVDNPAGDTNRRKSWNRSTLPLVGIPLCRRRLGLRCADETEMIGDQRRELLAAIAKVAEEPIDRGLEAGESRIVLIPKRGFLLLPR
jgi:hypothetical protein